MRHRNTARCDETQRTPREGSERDLSGIQRGRKSADDARAPLGAPREPLAPPDTAGTGQPREPPPVPPRPAAQRPRPGPSPHGDARRGPPGSPRTSQRRQRPQRRCPVPAHRARACSPLLPGPEKPRPALLGTCSPVSGFLPAPPSCSDYNSHHTPQTVTPFYIHCCYWFGPASYSDQSEGGSRRLGPRCAARRHWHGGAQRPISAGRGGVAITLTAGDWLCPQQPDQ